MKYYLYRHIRLDTNQPFYIGIGTKPKKYNSFKKEYQRAFVKQGRNTYWKNITNKTEYKIDILFESNDHDNIQEKEKEFITLYGRIDLGTGILVNYTDGGVGSSNMKFESQERIKNSTIRKIYQYSSEGIFIKEWNSISEASRKLKIHSGNITNCAKGKTPHCGGFIWSYDMTNIEPVTIQKNTNKPVYQYTLTGEFVKVWNRAKDIVEELNIGSSSITDCTNGKQKSAGGYQWSYTYKDFLPVYEKGTCAIVVHQYSLEGKFIRSWKNTQLANKEFGFSVSNINSCINGTSKTSNNFQWSSKKFDSIEPYKRKLTIKKIYQYTLNNDFIKEWPSVKSAKTELNINTNISSALSGKQKSAGGYKWSYSPIEKELRLIK